MIQRWNAFLEKRIAVLTPLFVLASVMFPQVTSKLVPFVPYMFAFMTFIGGLKSDFREVGAVLRKPLPLLVCLFNLHVLLPLSALLCGRLIFPGNINFISGMVLEFVVPAAVTGLMWTGVFHGNSPLSLALVVVDTFLAPFSMPLTLKLLLGSSIELDTMSMMRELLVMIALPALFAMCLNELTHGYTKKVLPGKLAIFSKLGLFFVVTANSSKIAPYVRHMSMQYVLVALLILLLACCGYASGFLGAYILKRPYDERVSMVFSSGMRNISTGSIIAAAYFPGEVMFPVMIGTLFQQVLAAGCGRLLMRQEQKEHRPSRE